MRMVLSSVVLLVCLTVLGCLFPLGTNGQDESATRQSQSSSVNISWRPVIEATRPAVVVIKTDKGQGSGFLIKSNGTIATNAHVIAGASAIEVKLATGETYRRVYILASDETEDIAILRIEAADLPALNMGNSNDVKEGDNVVLVGTPLGLEETISTGIISAIRVVPERGIRVIQTTAPASPGSSGGPLLNNKGEVIGLLSFSVVQGQSLNFAIPINYIRGKLDTLALSAGSQLMDSTEKPISNSTVSAQKQTGVILAGLSGPGTPQGSFEFIYVQLLDFLSGKGVDMMSQTANFKPMTGQVVSLNYYLENLPASGASGLLYMLVERPRNYKYIIQLQCFDAKGKLMWEEHESKDGWSETGATNGVLDKIKKRLLPRIGSAGLPIKHDNPAEATTARQKD